MILPKHKMSEEDIKLHYITPAILRGWSENYVTMECSRRRVMPRSWIFLASVPENLRCEGRRLGVCRGGIQVCHSGGIPLEELGHAG